MLCNPRCTEWRSVRKAHLFSMARLGPQKSDRQSVEERLVEGINELSNSFLPVCHHEMKRIVQVKLKLYAYLAYKPEKTKLLGLLQGQAYASRFGYVSNLTDNFDKLPCCDKCLLRELMKNNVEGTKHCADCFSFDFSCKTYTPDKSHPYFTNNGVLSRRSSYPI